MEMTGCSGERGEGGREGEGRDIHAGAHTRTHAGTDTHMQTQTLTAEHSHPTHSQVCLHFFSSQAVRSYRVPGPNTETKTTILTQQQHNNNKSGHSETLLCAHCALTTDREALLAAEG